MRRGAFPSNNPSRRGLCCASRSRAAACGARSREAKSGVVSRSRSICPTRSAGIGEITLNGHLFGTPTGDFARQAPEFTPRFMAAIRSQLANIEDRRKHPRVAADFAVTLYPIHSAGGVDTPIPGRVRDVSIGGICVATGAPLQTKYAYAVFEEYADAAPFAILVRFLRSHSTGREYVLGGQFRVDL